MLRDPIACKPAVMAETDDRSPSAPNIARSSDLPGIDDARVWEPEPANVYALGASLMRDGRSRGRRCAIQRGACTSSDADTNETHWRFSIRAASTRSPPASMPGHRRDRRTCRILLRRHEQAGDRHHQRQRRPGRRRKHDVGRGARQGRRHRRRPAPPDVAAFSSSMATRPRAAASR